MQFTRESFRCLALVALQFIAVCSLGHALGTFQSFNARATSATSVEITFTISEPSAQFEILKSTDYGPYVTLATLPGGGSGRYVDTSYQTSSGIQYQVKAFYNDITKVYFVWSPVAWVPHAPTALMVSCPTDCAADPRAKLRWSSLDFDCMYMVQRRVDAGVWNDFLQVNPTWISCSAKVACGKTTRFRVRAQTINGCALGSSWYSNIVLCQ